MRNPLYQSRSQSTEITPRSPNVYDAPNISRVGETNDQPLGPSSTSSGEVMLGSFAVEMYPFLSGVTFGSVSLLA